MGQSTVKISLGDKSFYGENVGPFVVVLDNGAILTKEDLESETLAPNVVEDTSGTVEITEELQTKADSINKKLVKLEYLTERYGADNIVTAPDEYENEEEV